ncbi:uncharacterized protein LOC105647171 isoform X2 [Jatropha curcas]|nr:uncharacterized protein LOC105647171 isoform X2 [Jatropha curcas]
MAEPWEEALDLDDSDLSSLRPFKHRKTTTAATSVSVSQPFLHRCTLSQSSQNSQNLLSQFHPPPPPSASPILIPGPAGTVQAAMLRRRNNQNDGNFTGDFGEEPIPTQEYIRRVVEEGVPQDDDDFTSDPWLYAVNFIRSQGLGYGDGAIGIPLSAVKSRNKMDRVAQVVAIVKSCTPNGFGDMMVTLKDPTGTIDATIHGGVLTEGEFGKNISIGSVIILQKIAVFSPSRSAHYLNITRSNMVKVISKDSELSLTHNCAASTVKHAAPMSEYNEKSWMPNYPLSLSQGRTEGIMNSLRQNANKRGSSLDQHMERDNATRDSCHGNGNNEDQNVVAGKQNGANVTAEVADGTDQDNNGKAVVCERLNPSSQAGRGNLSEGDQYGSAATGLIDVFDNQEIGNIDGPKWRRPPSSRVSVPQWTDEQLDKLFALD